MFGTNVRTGRSAFHEMAPDALKVTSMFYTIQGEGPLTGRPCLFLRLSKCNLACSFCDAMFEQGEDMTFKEIFAKLCKTLADYWLLQGYSMPPKWAIQNPYSSNPADLKLGVGLVITGGEPTLQKNLEAFVANYKQMFEWVQIETNGIITMELPDVVTVVSPKCSEQESFGKMRPVHYMQPSQKMLARADCLKFVMEAPIELPDDPDVMINYRTSPYETVPDWAHEWAHKTGLPVYVSPMNVYTAIPQKMKLLLGKTDKSLEERSTADEIVSFWEPGVLDMKANQRNHEYAARYAMQHGFRFQVQAHLLASLA